MADVMIMLEQLLIIYDIDLKSVEKFMDLKLGRLEQRLKGDSK